MSPENPEDIARLEARHKEQKAEQLDFIRKAAENIRTGAEPLSDEARGHFADLLHTLADAAQLGADLEAGVLELARRHRAVGRCIVCGKGPFRGTTMGAACRDCGRAETIVVPRDLTLWLIRIGNPDDNG